MQAKRFTRSQLAWLDDAKYVKIRAGPTHRSIHVWIVIIEGRVFARSWNNKPTGWYEAFLEQPHGALEIEGKEIRVRARKVAADSVLDAVTDAYGEKYTIRANERYVLGFAETGRRTNTLELVPAGKR